MSTGALVWLPGYFAQIAHLAVDQSASLTFHGVLITWSLCDRAVICAPTTGDLPACRSCVDTASALAATGGGGARQLKPDA